MDRKELWADPEEATRRAMLALQARMWTALPGFIWDYDPGANTATVHMGVSSLARADGDAYAASAFPLLPDVPIQFPGGGGAALTFPLKRGDECLLVFSSRPIDAWWQSGGVQRPGNARMHSMSDAVALVGLRSRGNVPAGISTTEVQLRSDDGQAVVGLNPTTHAITITAPGGVTVNAPTMTINAALVQGVPLGGGSSASSLIGPLNVDNDVTAAGKSVSTHHHTEHDGPATSPPV